MVPGCLTSIRTLQALNGPQTPARALGPACLGAQKRRAERAGRRARASAMAVELEIMHTARCTLARSPPGTTVGGW